MNPSIEQWDIDKAAQLHNIWLESTVNAPFAYAVESAEFATGIIPVESDDESCATSQSQKLIVASDATGPIGFAHLCAASDIEEMRCEGYQTAVLNCREKNHPAVSLYESEGYTTADTSLAYVKDLST